MVINSHCRQESSIAHFSSAEADAPQACRMNRFPVDETNASPELTVWHRAYWTLRLVNKFLSEYILLDTSTYHVPLLQVLTSLLHLPVGRHTVK